jgi:succinate-semialdehyde dehydrogenase/glutarate-semialdehyde dehydrogenase
MAQFQLKDQGLWQDAAYVDGAWLKAQNAQTLEVFNPSTLQKIGAVPDLAADEIVKAVEAAHRALAVWQGMTARARADLLRAWFNLILQHTDDLAQILTLEQGKPLAQAKSEIINGAGFVEWYAEEGRRIYGDLIPAQTTGNRLMVMKQPIGVCAMITPWNFPSSMITRKASAALAAGCTVVIKPSELTPYSALALAVLAERAGIPKGVINIVTGAPKMIGDILTTHPLVRKVSFTGSTAVGKLLMQQCASTVKKISLELGGNAPFIIFDDADLEAAVEGAYLSKFRNAGQTCICANRIFIHDAIYDRFAARFTARVETAKCGDGFAPEVELGPLINQKAVDKVNAQLRDAISKGAHITTGGKSAENLFFAPTVLKNVTREMDFFKNETFGPLAPLYRFQDEAEVITMANDTDYGLAAYVYTKDLGRFWRMSERLQYGMVGINSGLLSTEQAPFGGIKQSGFGREGSKYGIEDYLEIKLISVGGIS